MQGGAGPLANCPLLSKTVGTAATPGNKPGLSSSKGKASQTANPEESLSRASSATSFFISSSDKERDEAGGNKRKTKACRAANVAKRVILSTSESSEGEDGKEKRKRGRPALDPKHEGKFTAEALAKKAAEEAAKKLEEDHWAIIDSQISPASTRVLKANQVAEDFCESYNNEPINAVAAIMTQGLASIVK